MHGTGTMNTTVNFTYQFLQAKFALFHGFLFDQYVKSSLSKMRRWYKKNKDKYKNRARAMEAYKMGVGKTESTRYGKFRVGVAKRKIKR